MRPNWLPAWTGHAACLSCWLHTTVTCVCLYTHAESGFAVKKKTTENTALVCYWFRLRLLNWPPSMWSQKIDQSSKSHTQCWQISTQLIALIAIKQRMRFAKFISGENNNISICARGPEFWWTLGNGRSFDTVIGASPWPYQTLLRDTFWCRNGLNDMHLMWELNPHWLPWRSAFDVN